MFKALILLTIVIQGDVPDINRFELVYKDFSYEKDCREFAVGEARSLERYAKERLANASVSFTFSCERREDWDA